RPDPRHPEELGLPAGPQDGGPELNRTGRPWSRIDATRLSTGAVLIEDFGRVLIQSTSASSSNAAIAASPVGSHPSLFPSCDHGLSFSSGVAKRRSLTMVAARVVGAGSVVAAIISVGLRVAVRWVTVSVAVRGIAITVRARRQRA